MTLCRPRGTIVLKSTVALSKEINLAPLVIDEITLVGLAESPTQLDEDRRGSGLSQDREPHAPHHSEAGGR